jgi:hypothetical protein
LTLTDIQQKACYLNVRLPRNRFAVTDMGLFPEIQRNHSGSGIIFFSNQLKSLRRDAPAAEFHLVAA